LRLHLLEGERLPFPSGKATAELVAAMHSATDRGRRRARPLFIGAAFAAAFTWFRDGRPAFIPAMTALPLKIGGVPAEALGIGIGWSPLLLGTGVLIGLRGCISLLIGAAFAWCALAPWLVHSGRVADAAFPTVVNWLLWPGVAMILASSLTSLVLQWRTFATAFRGLGRLGATTRRSRGGVSAAIGVLVAIAAILTIGRSVFGLSLAALALAFFLIFLLGIVCARAAGETDLAPVGATGGLTQILM